MQQAAKPCIDQKILELNLSELAGLIPDTLLLKLSKLGIKNIAEAMQFKIKDFGEADHIGRKSKQAFIDFKCLVKNEPARILKHLEEKKPGSHQNKGLDKKINQCLKVAVQTYGLENYPEPKILDLKIEDLHGMISESLYRIFCNIGMKTIRDILNTRYIHFSNKHKCPESVKCNFQKLKEDIKNDPDEYYKYYLNKKIGTQLPRNPEAFKNKKLTELFFILLRDFLDLHDKKVMCDAMFMGFGIGGKADDIAGKLFINDIKPDAFTRFRTDVFNDFRKLLKGETLEKPKVYLQAEVKEFIDDCFRNVPNSPFFIFENFVNDLTGSAPEKLKPEEKIAVQYIIRFMHLGEIPPEKANFTKARLLYKKEDGFYPIINICSELTRILRFTEIPLTESNLKKRLSYGNFNLNEDIIVHALQTLPEIVIKSDGEKPGYIINTFIRGDLCQESIRRLKYKMHEMSTHEILNRVNNECFIKIRN